MSLCPANTGAGHRSDHISMGWRSVYERGASGLIVTDFALQDAELRHVYAADYLKSVVCIMHYKYLYFWNCAYQIRPLIFRCNIDRKIAEIINCLEIKRLNIPHEAKAEE